MIKLDPVGYFLIRITQNKEMELAFCEYKQEKGWYKNDIETKSKSKDPQKLIDWVIKNKLYSQEDHLEYLKKEFKRCQNCILTNTKYIQD